MPDTAELVRFQVTPEFATRLRTQAVAQRFGRTFPDSPQVVDATRAADQFGIPSSMFDDLIKNIRDRIVAGTTRRHVPKHIKQVTAVSYTISGKKVELAVTQTIHGEPVLNRDALANPEALDQYARIV